MRLTDDDDREQFGRPLAGLPYLYAIIGFTIAGFLIGLWMGWYW